VRPFALTKGAGCAILRDGSRLLGLKKWLPSSAPRDSCAIVPSGVRPEEDDIGAFWRSCDFRVFSAHLQADSTT